MAQVPNFGDLQSLPAGQAGSPKQVDLNHSLRLTKEQKIGVAVLSCFTLLVIIFWFRELNKNITYPFYGGMSKTSFENKVAADNANQAPLATSDNKDTDGDGLTDVQELTVYLTSPFLVDTDGDGISDQQEIKNSTNPNCPEGKQCSADGLIIGSEQLSSGVTTTVDLFNSSGATTNGSAVTTPVTIQPLDSASAGSLQQAFGDNPDPQYLRSQLISAATKQEDKDALGKISDEQLLEMYHSMINK